MFCSVQHSQPAARFTAASASACPGAAGEQGCVGQAGQVAKLPTPQRPWHQHAGPRGQHASLAAAAAGQPTRSLPAYTLGGHARWHDGSAAWRCPGAGRLGPPAGLLRPPAGLWGFGVFCTLGPRQLPALGQTACGTVGTLRGVGGLWGSCWVPWGIPGWPWGSP